MKVIVMGLIVFLASAAAGWFVKTSVMAPAEEEVGSEPLDLTADPMTPEQTLAVEPSEPMPVAVRDEAMSVEELLRFSMSLKEREKGLRQNEEQLQQRQVQQQLVLSDIQGEQQTIDGLRSQLSGQLASAQGMIDELNRLRDTVISERERTKQAFNDMESRQIDIDDQHQANDKKLSTWLQGMSSEKAAAVLKEMANDGNMEVAVQLLANFEEREAAKILDAIEDPKLLNEFVAQFRNLKNKKSEAASAKKNSQR